MSNKKVYIVLSKERADEPTETGTYEGAFSTYEKALEYINQFFANLKHNHRVIIESILDPYQEEIKSKNFYYAIDVYFEKKEFQVHVNRTATELIPSEFDKLQVYADHEFSTFTYMCFAPSHREALEKFNPHFFSYLKKDVTAVEHSIFFEGKRVDSI